MLNAKTALSNHMKRYEAPATLRKATPEQVAAEDGRLGILRPPPPKRPTEDERRSAVHEGARQGVHGVLSNYGDGVKR